MLDGVDITSRWQEQLASYLERQGDVEEHVTAWAAEAIAKDDAFAGWHYRSALQASLAGQLMVRAVELEEEAADGEEGTVKLEGRALPRGAIAARNADSAFLGLPFDEAVRFFRDKGVVTVEEFDAIADRFKHGGFTSRVVTSEALRDRILQRIRQMLSEGQSIQEIVRAIRADEVALGMSPASHDALDNIVRTNVATAYGHGRFEAQQDPVVMQLRPFSQYVSAGDSRVREIHRQLHGKVFRAGTDEARYYAAPLGFRCRCSNLTLSARQVERRGLVVIEGRIPGLDPDPGWEGAPAPFSEAA